MRDLIYYLYYLSCFILYFFSLLFTGPRASAQKNALQCFEFVIDQSPQRIPSYFLHTVPDNEFLVSSQVWCYWQGQRGEILIFNNDQLQLHEELALLIETDLESGKKYFTQGVLFQGQRRVVKTVDPGFSPFSIPLSLEEAQQQGMAVSLLSNGDRVLAIEALLNKFYQASLNKDDQVISFATFQEQREMAFLHPNAYPYDGYFWPQYRAPLAAGDHSPLGKYDRAQQARTGTDPGSVAQEKQDHAFEISSWRGHCNGWAASSVLYPKWRTHLWDEKIRSVILPSDVDGLRSETSYCVQSASYGFRYYNYRDDIKDIYPDKFHKVLRYYLKSQKKPIVMDVEANSIVDNHVITGYLSKFHKMSGSWYDVHTRLQVHKYNKARHEKTQMAKIYYRNYNYRLKLDSHGNILDGKWREGEGKNPDFLWVPLLQEDCGYENPALDERKVEGWLASLPEAERRTNTLNWRISRSIGRGETIELHLPQELIGTDYVLQMRSNGYERSLKVRAIADAHRYPTTSHKSPYKTDWKTLNSSTRELEFPVTNLRALEIKNPSFWSKATPSAPLVVESIQYWGAPTGRRRGSN